VQGKAPLITAGPDAGEIPALRFGHLTSKRVTPDIFGFGSWLDPKPVWMLWRLNLFPLEETERQFL
jgi:hypothetical protein